MRTEKRIFLGLIYSGAIALFLYVILESNLEWIIKIMYQTNVKMFVNIGEYIYRNNRIITAILNPVGITMLLTGLIEYQRIRANYKRKREEIFSLLVWCKFAIINLPLPSVMRKTISLKDPNMMHTAYDIRYKTKLLNIQEIVEKVYHESGWDDLVNNKMQYHKMCELRNMLWEIRTMVCDWIEICDMDIAGNRSPMVFNISPKDMVPILENAVRIYIESFYFADDVRIKKLLFDKIWEEEIDKIKKAK